MGGPSVRLFIARIHNASELAKNHQYKDYDFIFFSEHRVVLVDKTMYRDDHGYFVSLFAHEYCTQSFLSGSESAESQTAYQHH